MSLLKNGLNQEFYKWIDEVRRAFRKKDELEKELKELERRLVGYNAVSYDLIGDRGQGIVVEERILNILSKIDLIRTKIRIVEKMISRYYELFSKISVREKKILNMLLFNEDSKGMIIKKLCINKYSFYSSINKIVRLL